VGRYAYAQGVKDNAANAGAADDGDGPGAARRSVRAAAAAMAAGAGGSGDGDEEGDPAHAGTGADSREEADDYDFYEVPFLSRPSIQPLSLPLCCRFITVTSRTLPCLSSGLQAYFDDNRPTVGPDGAPVDLTGNLLTVNALGKVRAAPIPFSTAPVHLIY